MKTTKQKTVAERIAEGMGELVEAMRTGKPLHELFTVRTVEIPDPAVYDARAVRATRRRLSVSQAIFARLLGVSVELVEHWEQGLSVPRPVVRRLLDEVNRDPDGFRERHFSRIDRGKLVRA
jgi:DNA-binding transcriptional regulator YiaG